MIRVTAFRWVPPFAQGLVRDLRVRWALDEAGLPYEERLIGFEDQKTESYRRMQPFGQVPVYEEDGLVLFESGAIVLHIAEKSEALMPSEPNARARTKTWIFAALNSLEQHVQNYTSLDLFFAKEEWAKQRRPSALETLQGRLQDLARWMEGREYLEERFTAGDLMMSSVLRIMRHTELLAKYPVLAAYHQRCEARPAFQKALAAQMAPFAKNAPPGM
ncbi:glutathione S-transferase family protein [Hyalangium minutum]|uniref:glutathione S-transferase family protein n=1 Tax=Hyalangium minutum TaxID=394096 RepID=UPI0005C79F16|nr:glutathione S-transferase family protein [Hyalangium minutum]